MKTDNELIAEFMRNDAINSPHIRKPEYDNDWNELMLVVEKIEKMHNDKFHYDPVQISLGVFPEDNNYMDVISLPISTSIEQVHKEIVHFIKWYNSQPK